MQSFSPSRTDAAVRPASREAPRQARVPRISPVRPPGDEPAPRAPVVLVAEDHEDSRDALCTLLSAFGYRVVQASNGREALERARAEAPDLVLMDMMMPVMDGFQTARALREIPGLHDVRIVAVTAMEGAQERMVESGVDEIVTKPLDVRAFLQRIRSWAPVPD